MANNIMKGDAVILTTALEAISTQSANGSYFLEGVPLRGTKHKPPFKLNGLVGGLYLGTHYVPVFKLIRPRHNGAIQQLMHAFLFGNSVIYIKPEYVAVIAQIKDAVDCEK